VVELNALLRGWSGYFNQGAPKDRGHRVLRLHLRAPAEDLRASRLPGYFAVPRCSSRPVHKYMLWVMRRKTLASAVVTAAIAASVTVVVIPGFPEPSELISLGYADLQGRLGPPTVVYTDKFVGWSRSRFVATWVLTAGFSFPLRPDSRPGDVSRCLWVQWAGYTILCARSGRVQGSAPDS
jgi:hypothetical protein